MLRPVTFLWPRSCSRWQPDMRSLMSCRCRQLLQLIRATWPKDDNCVHLIATVALPLTDLRHAKSKTVCLSSPCCPSSPQFCQRRCGTRAAFGLLPPHLACRHLGCLVHCCHHVLLAHHARHACSSNAGVSAMTAWHAKQMPWTLAHHRAVLSSACSEDYDMLHTIQHQDTLCKGMTDDYVQLAFKNTNYLRHRTSSSSWTAGPYGTACLCTRSAARTRPPPSCRCRARCVSAATASWPAAPAAPAPMSTT